MCKPQINKQTEGVFQHTKIHTVERLNLLVQLKLQPKMAAIIGKRFSSKLASVSTGWNLWHDLALPTWRCISRSCLFFSFLEDLGTLRPSGTSSSSLSASSSTAAQPRTEARVRANRRKGKRKNKQSFGLWQLAIVVPLRLVDAVEEPAPAAPGLRRIRRAAARPCSTWSSWRGWGGTRWLSAVAASERRRQRRRGKMAKTSSMQRTATKTPPPPASISSLSAVTGGDLAYQTLDFRPNRCCTQSDFDSLSLSLCKKNNMRYIWFDMDRAGL